MLEIGKVWSFDSSVELLILDTYRFWELVGLTYAWKESRLKSVRVKVRELFFCVVQYIKANAYMKKSRLAAYYLI